MISTAPPTAGAWQSAGPKSGTYRRGPQHQDAYGPQHQEAARVYVHARRGWSWRVVGAKGRFPIEADGYANTIEDAQAEADQRLRGAGWTLA